MLQFCFLLDLAEACSDVECLNGGTCQNIDEKTFKCACLGDYKGDYCEKRSKWQLFLNSSFIPFCLTLIGNNVLLEILSIIVLSNDKKFFGGRGRMEETY